MTDTEKYFVKLVQFIRADQCDSADMRGKPYSEHPCNCCADYLLAANQCAKLAGLDVVDED